MKLAFAVLYKLRESHSDRGFWAIAECGIERAECEIEKPTTWAFQSIELS